MVNADGFGWGALCAGALAVIGGTAVSGCGASSGPRTDGSGAAAGVRGSVSGSAGDAGDAGADDGGVSGVGGAQSGPSGAGGTQSGASGSGGTIGGAESDAGSGGAAGNSGGGGVTAGGVAGEAGAPGTTLEPVRVIRGAKEQATWWDLTIQGVDLEAYEGKIATARIGHPDRPPERLGSGQARVEAGSFRLFFPEVWEATLYKYKRVYIDVNENGSCDAEADLVFRDSRATPDFVLTLRDSRHGAALSDLPVSREPEADCAVFNSIWPLE